MKIEIINNFLKENHLASLNALKLDEVKADELKVYHNQIKDGQVFKNSCIDEKLLTEIHKNYHPIALNILKKLNPEKMKLYDYSEFHIIETGANYVFPIHDDTPNKLLSGVVYLKPENNSGTIFYKDKKDTSNKEIVEWKPNRAVFFSRTERSTWHSYQGDGKSNRIVLVYNLMTYRIKDVFKIEKKSYFFGNLRYKLNPILHKYFKITI
jgi:hypothetical protein